MKPLSNMQLMMDVVIVANGLAIAAWIASKALLNLIQASDLWINLPAERSDSQTIAQPLSNEEYFQKLMANNQERADGCK